MTTKNSNITVKVLLGYTLLIVIGIFFVVYLYNVAKDVAKEEEPDNLSRSKSLVTKTLFLIYESEALGHFIHPHKNDYNKSLDNAQRNIDSLRLLTADSLHLSKIDTISLLIERKRFNTRQLVQTIKEMSSDHFFTKRIETITAIKDTITIEKYREVQQDTLIIPGKKKNFFQRLAHVFVPSQTDTTIVVNSSRQMLSDTLAYSPSEAIANTLKGLSDSIAYQRRDVTNQLSARMTRLQYDNNLITSKINQLLRDIESEEMNISYERIAEKQQKLKQTSHLVIFCSVLTLLIIAVFLFMIIKDISRSNFYRLKLEESNRRTENLLHSREKIMLMLSHDIRAPLSSISGYIELLQRLNPDQRQQYYLDNMTSSSQQILSLVNNLLDAYRLESGQVEIHPIPFGIKSLFNEIHTNFKPLTDAKGLDFHVEIKEQTDDLYAIDPILVKQIVNNLLSNAVKFTHEGSISLHVSTQSISSNKSILIIRISDTGFGIPEEEQEKIFEEFKRLEQNEAAEGFGLGLSIAGKLVQLMNGEISLQSVPEKGSTFTVTLPLEKIQVNKSGIENVARHTALVQRKKQIHCLIVDDDVLQLTFMKELLMQYSISSVVCSNPRKVTELLHNGSFDVVFTDISMPGINGYQLLDMIRNSGIPKTNKLPVVALTGYTDKSTEYYQKAGFAGYLSKPLYANQLISLLSELFDISFSAETNLKFSSLTAFAEEDKASSLSILRTFSEETQKNTCHFEQALDAGDVEAASALSHKIIPIFIMLEAKDLVALLHQLEKGNELSEDIWQKTIAQVIQELKTTHSELNKFILAL